MAQSWHVCFESTGAVSVGHLNMMDIIVGIVSMLGHYCLGF